MKQHGIPQVAGFVLLSFLSAFGLIVLSMAGMEACEHYQPAHEVVKAAWIEAEGGPALLVHERLHHSGDSQDWTTNRFVLLDPSTGEVRARWFSQDDEGSMARTVLLSARGPWIWLYQGDSWRGGITLARADTGEATSTELLAARYPQVLSPWYRVEPGEDGLLYVEADDRKRWRIDPAGGAAEEVVEPEHTILKARFLEGCYADAVPSREWRIDKEAVERHSDIGTGVIVGSSGVVLRGLRLPRFVCAEGQGPVLLDGDPVLVEDLPRAFSRIRSDGSRAWTWTPEPAENDGYGMEGWAWEGGAILKLNRRFVSLDGQGNIRWDIRR